MNRNEILKVTGHREHIINKSWGVYDAYKWIRKNKWFDIGRPLKEDEFYNDIVFTNKEVVLELLDMWEQYHLKTITTEQVGRLNELLDKLEPYNFDDNELNVKEFVLGVVDNEEEANVNCPYFSFSFIIKSCSNFK